jgi:excisionase family DNA binding protein
MSSDAQQEAAKRLSLAANSPLVDKLGAAKFLGDISTRTVDNYMRDGSLPFVKLGRRVLFRRTDLETLIASNVQRREAA